MSKIICDVCGSAYSDTASQCPICGTAKRDNPAVAQEAPETVTTDAGYSYVKGGRFSHANVRKHNNGKELSRKTGEKTSQNTSTMPPLIPEQEEKAPEVKKEKPVQPKPEKKPEPKPERDPDLAEKRTNMILMIVVLILLLAVVFVGVYIVNNYKDLFPSVTEDPNETESTSQGTIDGVRIPCVGITLPALEMVESDGTPIDLKCDFTPSTTTDEVTYASSDPAIASVDEKGILTVWASGEVTITVSCGDQTAELVLNCVFAPPTTSTDPSESQPGITDFTLAFIDTDLSFTEYGIEWQMYKGEVDASLITFTSSDESIVTIDATGKIKVVGKGTATITAQYGGQTAQCIIRCDKVTLPTATEYDLWLPDFGYSSKGDITIKVGNKIKLQLLNTETQAPVTGLTWYTSMDAYVTIESTKTGVTITATGASGKDWVRVMCDYEGVTYTCIVRVKPAS